MKTTDLIIDSNGKLKEEFMTSVSGSEIVGIVNWVDKKYKNDGAAIKKMTFHMLRDDLLGTIYI